MTSEKKPTEKQEVILERNTDAGFSLRAILAAYRIIKRKLEESDRVKRNLSIEQIPDYRHHAVNISPTDPIPVPSVTITDLKITHLKCNFMLMDDGLFLIPDIAILEGGGS